MKDIIPRVLFMGCFGFGLMDFFDGNISGGMSLMVLSLIFPVIGAFMDGKK